MSAFPDSALLLCILQCVSLDLPNFVILLVYPEIKAAAVEFKAERKLSLCSFFFRIDNETGRIQRNTLYSSSIKA